MGNCIGNPQQQQVYRPQQWNQNQQQRNPHQYRSQQQPLHQIPRQNRNPNQYRNNVPPPPPPPLHNFPL